MPTPKTKRDIVLQSTFSSTSLVATFNLGVNAEFRTGRGLSADNIFEDSSSGSTDEVTEYLMTISATGGALVGTILINFTGRGDAPAVGLTVAKTSAISDIDPPETTSTITPPPSPDASYSRVWQQAVLDATSVQVVDQVGSVDVQVKAGSTYTVTQTVISTVTADLALEYEWKNAAGQVVISGSLNFTASSVAGDGYSLATATATDNGPLLLRARERTRDRARGDDRGHRPR
ncbi:MAG: hypothetical protein H0T76_26000 [Nannocystis sp.]|nr:hypothetical protein [Nannocystis sp.]MBA3549946.1 hypothetical protein [Nannocystis sp.]